MMTRRFFPKVREGLCSLVVLKGIRPRPLKGGGWQSDLRRGQATTNGSSDIPGTHPHEPFSHIVLDYGLALARVEDCRGLFGVVRILLAELPRRLHYGKLLAKTPRAFLPLTRWWGPLHTPEGLTRLTSRTLYNKVVHAGTDTRQIGLSQEANNLLQCRDVSICSCGGWAHKYGCYTSNGHGE